MHDNILAAIFTQELTNVEDFVDYMRKNDSLEARNLLIRSNMYRMAYCRWVCLRESVLSEIVADTPEEALWLEDMRSTLNWCRAHNTRAKPLIVVGCNGEGYSIAAIPLEIEGEDDK